MEPRRVGPRAPKGVGGRRAGPSKTPKWCPSGCGPSGFATFFFLSSPHLGVFSWNFGGVCECRYPSPDPLSRNPLPSPGTVKISFFLPLPPKFSFFLPSFRGLWNFGGVFRGFEAAGAAHDSPRAPNVSHLRVPALQNAAKIPGEDPPREGRKNENCGGREKKSAKFWAVRRRRGPGEERGPAGGGAGGGGSGGGGSGAQLHPKQTWPK